MIADDISKIQRDVNNILNRIVDNQYMSNNLLVPTHRFGRLNLRKIKISIFV